MTEHASGIAAAFPKWTTRTTFALQFAQSAQLELPRALAALKYT